MSCITLTNGARGESYKLGIDAKSRALVAGQTDSAEKVASREGRLYNVNSGILTLTNDSESAIIYIKNTEDSPLILQKIDFHIDTSTGGSGSTTYTGYINPTGTITSNTDINAINLNLSELLRKPFSSTAKSGGQGITATSSNSLQGILPTPGYFEIEANITLPKGASAATSITPPTGNTSQKVVIEYICYYLDSETGD